MVRITKPMIKKLIGYISSIVVLVFLGEPFLDEAATIVGYVTQDGAI